MFIYRPYHLNLLVLVSTVTDLSVDESNESSYILGVKHLNGLILKVMYRGLKLDYVHLIKYQFLFIDISVSFLCILTNLCFDNSFFLICYLSLNF